MNLQKSENSITEGLCYLPKRVDMKLDYEYQVVRVEFRTVKAWVHVRESREG